MLVVKAIFSGEFKRYWTSMFCYCRHDRSLKTLTVKVRRLTNGFLLGTRERDSSTSQSKEGNNNRPTGAVTYAVKKRIGVKRRSLKVPY